MLLVFIKLKYKIDHFKSLANLTTLNVEYFIFIRHISYNNIILTVSRS